MIHVAKILLIFLVAQALSGCLYLTGRLSTVGVRTNRLNGQVETINEDGVRGSGRAGVAKCRPLNYYGWSVPYSYSPLAMSGEGDAVHFLAKINRDLNSVAVTITQENGSSKTWLAADAGEVFHAKPGQNLYLRGYPNRRWWGYPPQILIVATVPLDILIFPFEWLFGPHHKAPGP